MRLSPYPYPIACLPHTPGAQHYCLMVSHVRDFLFCFHSMELSLAWEEKKDCLSVIGLCLTDAVTLAETGIMKCRPWS